MKKIFFTLSLLYILGLGNTYASWSVSGGSIGGSAINNAVSDINTKSYEIDWFPAHETELGGNILGGKFQDVSGVATLLIDGTDNSKVSIDDGDNFNFIGEGTLVIKTFAIDNADNITTKEISYKIDKTGPKLGDLIIAESSQYAYALGTENVSTVLKKYDSTDLNTQIVSSVINYVTETPVEKDFNLTSTDIQEFRYKGDEVVSGSFSLNNHNDDYGTLSSEISGLDRIDYIKNGSVISTNSNPGASIDISAGNFGLSPNTGEVIHVRLYDNAGNYSEKAFYAYNDISIPNSNLFTFKFINDEDMRLSSLNSKFISANDQFRFKYDWGVLNNDMSDDIILQVETDSNTSFPANSQDLTFGSTSGTSGGSLSLTKVDNFIRSGNYRNYSTNFVTDGLPGVCDTVGNCIASNTLLGNLRVMAGNIDIDKSEFSIDIPSSATANNPANLGADKYSFIIGLEDEFGNRIRPVQQGPNTIRTVETKLDFINGLTQNLGGYTVSNPVAVIGTEITDPNEINTSSKLALQEPVGTANGLYSVDIFSRIPTYGGYPYMRNDSELVLNSIEIDLDNNNSFTEDQADQSVNNSFSTDTSNNIVDINSQIIEDSNNRLNVTHSLASYGNISTAGNNTTFLADISTKRVNLEFSAPFLYHAKNLNILRDGIDSQHEKIFVDSGTSININNVNIVEQYFDVDSLDTTTGNTDNIKTDFYIDNSIENNLVEIGNLQPSGTGSFNVRYEANPGENFDQWGYRSYIKYPNGDGFTYMPSISRGIVNSSNMQKNATAYFPNVTYGTGGTDFLTEDIVIDGLVNKTSEGANTTVQPGQVSLDLERPYTRSELLQKVKRNISNITRNITWCTGNISSINFDSSSNCHVEFNGENIVFYKGDVNIDCGNICEIDGFNTLIVQDGRLDIQSNLNTNITGGQLLVISISSTGLENIDLESDYNDISKHKGWITIDENITNIDAFMLAQGPILSADTGVIINNFPENKRLNQLHIYGSLFSLNTINGSNTNSCPYIEESVCSSNESKIYDLSFLRRYTLVDAGNYGGTAGANVPYDPSLFFDTAGETTIGKSSGGFVYKEDGSKEVNGYGMRITVKPEHINAPVIVERDNRWTINPSVIFEN